MTTPPFLVIAFNISSVILRGALVSARADEWEAMIGALLVAIASQKVRSDTCEMSTIMPRRFISKTTFLPKSVSPWVAGVMPGVTTFPDDSAHSFEFDQLNVM